MAEEGGGAASSEVLNKPLMPPPRGRAAIATGLITQKARSDRCNSGAGYDLSEVGRSSCAPRCNSIAVSGHTALAAVPSDESGREEATTRPAWESSRFRIFQKRLHQIYNKESTQHAIAGLIIANFLLTVLNLQIDAKSLRYDWVFRPLYDVINLLFLVEILCNFIAHGRQFFCSLWNWFEAFVVFVGLLYVLNVHTGFSKGLRVVRAIRVFRLLKRVQPLHRLFIALIRSMPGGTWATARRTQSPIPRGANTCWRRTLVLSQRAMSLRPPTRSLQCVRHHGAGDEHLCNHLCGAVWAGASRQPRPTGHVHVRMPTLEQWSPSQRHSVAV